MYEPHFIFRSFATTDNKLFPIPLTVSTQTSLHHLLLYPDLPTDNVNNIAPFRLNYNAGPRNGKHTIDIDSAPSECAK